VISATEAKGWRLQAFRLISEKTGGFE
jgi:hypothetical protein